MRKVLFVMMIAGLLLSGCAGMTQNNPNQLEKSPCSCLDINKDVNNGIS